MLVGRPGLDPGTLGSDQARPGASLKIHFTWSDSLAKPPTSAEILSSCGVRLHQRLHTTGSEVTGVMRHDGSGGESFELRIDL